jgi:hypothetical protein
VTFIVLIAIVWLALALPVGLLIGGGIRLADGRDPVVRRWHLTSSSIPDFVPDEALAVVAAQRRRGA